MVTSPDVVLDGHPAPLDGCTVVVTRPALGALADGLSEAGATVCHVPLIEVEAPVGAAAVTLADAVARLANHAWLVVTSANGAAAVGEATRSHPALRLGAIGHATAAILQELAGRPVDLVPARASVEGLLDEFPSPLRAGESVLVVHADRAADELPNGLDVLGYEVTRVVGYRTLLRVPTANEEAILRAADVVVLASGSAAQSLAATAAATAAGPLLVAIGPSTTTVAAASGLHMAAVARSPRPDDVVAAVVAAIGSRRSSAPGLP